MGISPRNLYGVIISQPQLSRIVNGVSRQRRLFHFVGPICFQANLDTAVFGPRFILLKTESDNSADYRKTS